MEDWKKYLSGLGAGKSGESKTASSSAEANVDYGTTDRSKGSPWAIVAVAGIGMLGAVLLVALFTGKDD